VISGAGISRYSSSFSTPKSAAGFQLAAMATQPIWIGLDAESRTLGYHEAAFGVEPERLG